MSVSESQDDAAGDSQAWGDDMQLGHMWSVVKAKKATSETTRDLLSDEGDGRDLASTQLSMGPPQTVVPSTAYKQLKPKKFDLPKDKTDLPKDKKSKKEPKDKKEAKPKKEHTAKEKKEPKPKKEHTAKEKKETKPEKEHRKVPPFRRPRREPDARRHRLRSTASARTPRASLVRRICCPWLRFPSDFDNSRSANVLKNQP
jgi:outer membrane biosynthesis protein TonB